MSIPTEANRDGYTGNDSFDDLPYTYRITDEADITIVVRNTDTGDETLLTLTTHYTVAGVGDAGGGNATLIAGFAWTNADGTLKTGWVASVLLAPPLTQESDFRNQGQFFGELHEDAFDKACRVDQKQQDEIDRSFKLPKSIDPASFDTTLPGSIADNPGSPLIVNDAGDGITFGAIDITRWFKRATFAELKTLAATQPTTQRFGFATDMQALVYYTGNAAEGDGGWIVLAGAGAAPATDGGPI